jgi:hypothetical protein
VLGTAIALTLINVALAALIVQAIGASTLAPLWLSVVLLALGLVAAAGAVVLWRNYLTSTRHT